MVFVETAKIGYNEAMNETDYYLGENERAYVNPTVSRDETLGFVDTLRGTIGRENQRISSQTQNLGTDVPSSLGGLMGSGSYFQQRYQTMPVESAAATLKATAQAKALNDIMSNYEAQAKNRYNQAYRNAVARAKTSSGGSEGVYSSEEPEAYTSSEDILMTTDWGGRSVRGYGTADGYRYYQDINTGEILATDDPDYYRGDDGIYYRKTVDTSYSYNPSREEQVLGALFPSVGASQLGARVGTWLNNNVRGGITQTDVDVLSKILVPSLGASWVGQTIANAL